MKWFAVFVSSALLTVGALADMVYPGNTNGGFGGPVGQGSLSITDDGVNINFSLTRGVGGDLNNHFVLYFDTTTGGASDTSSFTDAADPGRRAISGFDGANRSTVNFAAGFGADSASSFDAVSGGFLFNTSPANNFGFIAGMGGAGAATDAVFTFSTTLANLGVTAGDSFNFVGTYLNESNAFRSDEGFGSGLPSGNPGASPVTFSNSLSYVTAPEPSSIALLFLGFGALLYRRVR